jgi:adhesin/invasin
VTTMVVDRYNNHVTDGIVVTFATNLGAIAPLTQPTTGGVATSTLTSGNIAGTAMVTATAGIAVGTLPVTFTAGPPFTVTVAAFPTSTVVGAPVVITAAVQDQHANPVTDGTVVTFATSLGSLAPPTGTTTSGSVAAALTSTIAGPAIVTATVGARWGTTIVTFKPGVPFTVTVSASPLVIPIGGDASTVTATARDQYGNLVSDGVLVNFSTNLGTVSPSFTGTVSGAVTTTLISGLITGTARVYAYSGVASGSVEVTFTVGPPHRVIVVAQPPTITVATGTSVIGATVLDIGNNPVANGTVVTFATSLGAINPLMATTISGVAQTTLTAISVAGTAVVTAAAGTVSGTTTVVFAPGPPATMTLVAFPTSIPVGGATSAITATVRDLYSNFVANGTGVSFATGLGTFQQSGSTTYYTTTTGGIATATLVSGLSIGIAQVSAVAGSILQWVNVTFTIGPPRYVTVTALPNSIPIVNGSSTVTAIVRDVGNNPVTNGTVVTFATSLGMISPPTATTISGLALATLTSGTRTGTAIVTATVDSRVGTTNVTFTTPYPPYTVTVTAYPTQIPADGVSTSAITATVTEIYGNPVADGITANFFVTAGAAIAPPTAPTISGIATATLTAGTRPTTVTVRVIAGSRLGETNVVLYAPPLYKLYLPVLYKNYGGGW